MQEVRWLASSRGDVGLDSCVSLVFFCCPDVSVAPLCFAGCVQWHAAIEGDAVLITPSKWGLAHCLGGRSGSGAFVIEGARLELGGFAELLGD